MKYALLDLGQFNAGGIATYSYHLKYALKKNNVGLDICSNKHKIIIDHRARLEILKSEIANKDVLLVSGFFVNKKQRQSIYDYVNSIKIPKVFLVHGLSEDIESICSNVKFNMIMTISKNMRDIFTERLLKVGIKTPVEYVLHPYKRWSKNENNVIFENKVGIISTARMDFCKAYDCSLKAAEKGWFGEYKIHHTGYIHRPYIYWKLRKELPIVARDPFNPQGEWRRKYLVEHNPNMEVFVYNSYTDAVAMIDLTHVKDDGGRSQYTTLEAMDFACIPIISREWASIGTYWKEGYNCLCVDHKNYREFKTVIPMVYDKKIYSRIITANYKRLKRHRPSKIGRQFVDLVGKYV